MKKHSFILVELLICIAILSLCALPLIGYPYYSFKKQKADLLAIEYERQAEILFFDLLKDLNLNWKEVSTSYSEKTFLPPKEIQIDGLGTITIYPHYHLFVHPNAKKKGNAKFWCCFCIEKDKAHCSQSYTKHSPYTFNFFAKKVEEKPQDSSKEKYYKPTSRKDL